MAGRVGVRRSGRAARDGGFVAVVVVAILAIAVTLLLATLLERRSRRQAVEVGFWFEDDVRVRGVDGFAPLTDAEVSRLRAVARAEIDDAFRGLRIGISDRRGAGYRVRVLNQFSPRPGPPGPLGESRPLGPLGGEAAVCLQALAARAVEYAPPNADRAAIVDAIGRGIGRTAVHELAHVMLFGEMRTTTDPGTYECEIDGYEHYYGTVRWTTALPLLQRRFAR